MRNKTNFFRTISKLISALLLLSLLGVACAQAMPSPTPTQSSSLTVMTHDSFAASEAVIAAFEAQHQVKVQFLKAGDVGSALNKAILAKGSPLADVFYGVDNTFLSRALAEDIFEPYASPLLKEIAVAFQLDGQNRALPVDYGDVCLNYDRAYFADQGLQLPHTLDDLLKPQYRSLLVVQNAALSSPGLAFLLATIGVYGEEGYLDYWRGLVENDVKVVNDWETAYYTEFSVHGGTRPIVVSYSSSPPAEVIFAETPIDEPPTGVVTEGKACFRQIEFVGILKGTPNRSLAEKWIDFMLDQTFQEDVPLQMFVFPVNPRAKLPEEFTKFVVTPTETAQVTPQAIEQNREAWIQAWTETVLR